jgi:hypothetical protein
MVPTAMGAPITRRVEPLAQVGIVGSSQTFVGWSVSNSPGTARTTRPTRFGCACPMIFAIRACSSVAADRVGTAKYIPSISPAAVSRSAQITLASVFPEPVGASITARRSVSGRVSIVTWTPCARYWPRRACDCAPECQPDQRVASSRSRADCGRSSGPASEWNRASEPIQSAVMIRPASRC